MELSPSSVCITTAVKEILKFFVEPDFILFIGDGKADEALFSAFTSDATHHTVTVGRKRTEAKAYVDSVKEVEDLLFKFVEKQ